ncbi:MAG: NTP transferase domain-containing protein [Acidobacteriota bacterium]
MKAILLAAGRGSRLHPMTQSTPKALVTVGARTCLDIALESLAAVADSIAVVTGHLGDKISTHLVRHPPSVLVQVVVNPKPEQGNLTSLAAARALMEGDGFILTNADHLFPADFYRRHFVADQDIAIAAQNDRPILDDEMKVVVQAGHLREISKTLSTYDGAYIGTTRVPAHHSCAYWEAFDRVEEAIDPARACVEDVLQALAHSETPPRVAWINNLQWFEVDTLLDLENARKGLT